MKLLRPHVRAYCHIEILMITLRQLQYFSDFNASVCTSQIFGALNRLPRHLEIDRNSVGFRV